MANKYKMSAEIGLHLAKQKLEDNYPLQAESKLKLALKNINFAIQEDGSDYTLHALKGEILNLMQDYDEAICSYDKYLESKKDPKIIIQKVRAYISKADFENAWSLLIQTIDNYPNFADAYVESAELANFVSDYDTALFICDKFNQNTIIFNLYIDFQEAQALYMKDWTIDAFKVVAQIEREYPGFLNDSFYLYDGFKGFCMAYLGNSNSA